MTEDEKNLLLRRVQQSFYQMTEQMDHIAVMLEAVKPELQELNDQFPKKTKGFEVQTTKPFGAPITPETEWQEGKTAASIQLGSDIEKFLADGNCPAEQQEGFTTLLELIKAGKIDIALLRALIGTGWYGCE